MNDQEMREILAQCYERQLQPKDAVLCRAGIRTYAICAALDAMRRVVGNSDSDDDFTFEDAMRLKIAAELRKP